MQMLSDDYEQDKQGEQSEPAKQENGIACKLRRFPENISIRNCRKITDATCLDESPEIQGKRLSTRISYL